MRKTEKNIKIWTKKANAQTAHLFFCQRWKNQRWKK